MAELLSTLSIVSFAIAGICFVVLIFFWFFFKIPKVIGDLSGTTAKKSIAKMRSANEKSGSKGYRESKINAERGKLTDTMRHSRNFQNAQNVGKERPDTGLLNENYVEQLFTETNGILNSDTTGLLIDEEATDSLSNPKPNIPIKRDVEIKLKILEEVILIHTEEVIR